MVKILSNGEIVADDDPRASVSNRRNDGSSRNSPSEGSSSGAPASSASGDDSNDASSGWRFSFGSPTPDDGAAAAGRGAMGGPASEGNSVTVFHLLNQKLLDAGIPRVDLGPYSAEPIALVATCLAVLLFGLHGLLLALVLFLVVKFSRHGVPSMADLTRGNMDGARINEGRGVGDAGTRVPRRRDPETLPEPEPTLSSDEQKWGAGRKLGHE